MTKEKEHEKDMVWKRFKNGVLFEKITKKTKNYDKTKFPLYVSKMNFWNVKLSCKIPKISAGTLWVAWSWTNRSMGGLSVWFNLLPVVDRCQWNTSIFAGRTERRLIELKAQLLILNGQACPENKGRTAKVAVFWGKHNGGLL